MSTEHDVSLLSAKSVIQNINKNKYEIIPIYINKNGDWYKFGNLNNKIDNIFSILKTLDVAFPVMHGKYGEDGSIQGLLEMLRIPYVGCKILASSVGMDKVYSKIIFEKANIKQAKYEYIRRFEDKFIYIDREFNERMYLLEEIVEIISNNLKFPLFIKPSNSGSSIGINKAKTKEELKEYIKYASEYDNKILVEEGIEGKEVECAVLGNEEVISSCVGEIIPAEEYYTYDAKYNNKESVTIIPADIDKEISNEIRDKAIKAFKAISGSGLARVDFFVEKNTNNILINEINTMPGFTEISMYPQLFEQVGIKYSELLDKLIEISIRRGD